MTSLYFYKLIINFLNGNYKKRYIISSLFLGFFHNKFKISTKFIQSVIFFAKKTDFLPFQYPYRAFSFRKKNTTTSSESDSATTTALQIPSSPNSLGRIRMHATWNKNVRTNEMAADTSPLLSAVKNELPKILKPHNKKEIRMF